MLTLSRPTKRCLQLFYKRSNARCIVVDTSLQHEESASQDFSVEVQDAAGYEPASREPSDGRHGQLAQPAYHSVVLRPLVPADHDV